MKNKLMWISQDESGREQRPCTEGPLSPQELRAQLLEWMAQANRENRKRDLIALANSLLDNLVETETAPHDNHPEI